MRSPRSGAWGQGWIFTGVGATARRFRWRSLSPVPTGDGMIVRSVIRDISDRKRIEEDLRQANEELDRRKGRELRDSQNRLALIVDSSLDAIIGKNLDGIITHWRQRCGTDIWLHVAGTDRRPITVLAPAERSDEIPGEFHQSPTSRKER